MSDKPERIEWNPDMETFEAIYSDGFILPLRDDLAARELASEHGMKVEDDPNDGR